MLGKPRGGAVCFVQMFGSALQLTPHLHVSVPEGVFDDVQAPWPEDDFEELQARGAQLRLLPPDEPQPGRKGRLAVAHGMSLHADTWVTLGYTAMTDRVWPRCAATYHRVNCPRRRLADSPFR